MQKGYDSTWSEVDQLLNNQTCRISDGSKLRTSRVLSKKMNRFFSSIQTEFGSTAVVIINNIMQGWHSQKDDQVFLKNADILNEVFTKYDVNKIKQLFEVLFHNIHACFEKL